MYRLPFFLIALPFVLGDTGGSSGSSGSGGATNGQVQLNIQQQSTLDNGNQNSVGQSQNIVSGTSLNIGGSSSSSLQYDPMVTANPASASGNNYVTAYGNAITGVLQNNQNSQSNSSSDGQHHNVASQSMVTGNGTGVSVSNSLNGNLYLHNPTTTTSYPTRFPCSYITCYGYGCTVIENGYSCYCACPSTGYYDTTYPPPYPTPLRAAEASEGSHADVRQRKTVPAARNRGQNVKAAREQPHSRAQGKAHAKNSPTTPRRNSRSKA